MAKIAFILLCHKDPDAVVRQAKQLTATGDCVAIHFDGNAPVADFVKIKDALAGHSRIAFAKKRIKCGWGEWSLIRATLSAMEAAAAGFADATHFFLLSGDCMPIKSSAFAREFLDRENKDFIESFDFHSSNWIKTGMKEDRLRYRHFFNERSQKRFFYASLSVQEKLGLTRSAPADIDVMIGSQWWCLRRKTVERILAFVAKRKDVLRFFSTTWIPDETFFQTLVRHLIAREEIETRTLTFLMFTDYGMPVTFYNDHRDLLLSQNGLFARKVSGAAQDLRENLGALWASDRRAFPDAGDGQKLYAFLAGKGRVGQRFAPRFWEQEASIGRERELLVLVSKKWHVAKRFARSIAQSTSIPTLHYVFDEQASEMPTLGGIETTLEKRNRHRRAVMRMLYGRQKAQKMLICVDPSNFALLEDVYRDSATVRMLHLQCDFDDAYLVGHAQRVGLLGEDATSEIRARVLPTLRYDFDHETARIEAAGFGNTYTLTETASLNDRTDTLRHFLNVDPGDAARIAEIPHLFAD